MNARLAQVAIVFLMCSSPAFSELILNFTPDKTGTMKTCITHGSSCSGTQTPFLSSGGFELPEVVTDPDTGITYYHMIIGDAADGFIQESYIQRGYSSWQGGAGSAVGGAGGANGGNGVDPLDVTGINSATGEANPRKVLVRQLVSDGEIMMEFLKDKFDKKPLITQQLFTSDLISQFQIDMRNSSYGDDTTPGIVTNTLNILGVDSFIELGFDMASDAQDSVINGGRYIYTDGVGPGGSDGTYSYIEGGFDQINEEWERYFDFTENNPWSYNANKPQQ